MNRLEPLIQQLQQVNERLAEAERRFARVPGSVQLLAVSKTHPVEKIRALISAGQLTIGESYLQEAIPKINQLSDCCPEWHFIGPIQSNKTKDIAENFHWVHAIDRIKIAQRLNAQRPEHLDKLNVCLQINISAEPSKAGILLSELPQLAEQVMLLKNIKLRGLMAIPAPSPNFATQREPFRHLRLALDDLSRRGMQLDTLSMGMSNDMEAAIAEGATIVRIGTALFGARPGTL